MKLLMFFSPEFWFKPFEKVLVEMPEAHEEQTCTSAVVIFYQAEAEDEGREEKVIAKWVKNAKWLAGKFNVKTVVLHSFNHLSLSKAPLETALFMTCEVRKRLERTSYTVVETPFGYLNEWKMHVAGDSLAKVFKDI